MRADVRCLCVAVSVSADTNNERCQQIGVRRVVSSTVQSQNQRINPDPSQRLSAAGQRVTTDWQSESICT